MRRRGGEGQVGVSCVGGEGEFVRHVLESKLFLVW